ncbi:excalibur calcium-binding domain-containing protein [Mollicutes bacterium LVI A0078]|nr:excalibur calcium-binding domain-containing protein [Mollicutes bacterium LVI A0078]
MKLISFLLSITLVISGCSQVTEEITNVETPQTESDNTDNNESTNNEDSVDTAKTEPTDEKQVEESDSTDSKTIDYTGFDISNNTIVSADSCSLSGGRVENAKVDIGYDSNYANREYWAYTNEYGQLVYVEAAEIILQNDDKEIGGDDRYCSDEAKVPGVEESDLDEGHVIADSLGGASNAYNITPQGSQLNRHGTQADIEEDIREAGGATNFTATITYPDTDTQIPSEYTLSYTVNGQEKSQTFANEYTPDGSSSVVNESTDTDTTEDTSNENTSNDDVYYANCTEVRDAGASPIHKGDPGYSTNLDRDGDGVGCE